MVAAGQNVRQVVRQTYDNSGNLVTRRSGLPVVRDSVFIKREKSQALSVDVHPNPTSGLLQILISVDNQASPVTLTIYNTAGAAVLSSKTNEAAATADITCQPDGIYTLTVEYEDLISSTKLIKQ